MLVKSAEPECRGIRTESGMDDLTITTESRVGETYQMGKNVFQTTKLQVVSVEEGKGCGPIPLQHFRNTNSKSSREPGEEPWKMVQQISKRHNSRSCHLLGARQLALSIGQGCPASSRPGSTSKTSYRGSFGHDCCAHGRELVEENQQLSQ